MTGESGTLSAEMRSWRFRVFGATWLSYFGFYFCRKPFYIAKGALEENLGFDPTVLAAIGTAYLVAYTLGQFVSAKLGDRFGPRILLLVGMGVSIATNVVFGFSNSWQNFAVFMAINGLAQATGWSCNVGTMAFWFRRKERGTVMGIWATNYQVGGVLANGLAAYMLGKAGFEYAFFAGSAVLMLVWLIFLTNQRNRPEDVGLEPLKDPDETYEKPGQKTKWTKDQWLNVLTVGIFYFFVKFIRYALWSWAPYLLFTHFRLDLDDAGYVSTIFDVAGVAGVIVAGIISDLIFSGRRAFVSFLSILALTASCFFLYYGGGASLIVFSVAIGFIGFFLYGPDALMTGAGAIDVGSRESATLAAGIINGMGSVGAVAQELALGVLLEHEMIDGVFATLVGSSLLAVLCLGFLLTRNRSGKADM